MLLLGELSDQDAAPLEEHLLTCQTCVARTRSLRSADTLLVALQREGGQSFSAAQSSAIDQLVRRFSDRSHLATHSSLLDSTQDFGPKSSAEYEDLTSLLEPAAAPDELGRLGGFRVLKLLGQGGMGAVFLAEDIQLRRQVALKVIRPEQARRTGAVERFLREARAAAAVRHDNVVTIYQVGEARGIPFIAQELLDGETLDECLKRDRRLPIAEALRIGREIAAGLAAAHHRGLLHRDVKPSNIWLEEHSGPAKGQSSIPPPSPQPLASSRSSSRVKILDFGLARSQEGDEQLTQSGTIVGTPAYMSPEQATGQPLDARSDLFSLGGVLFRMVTGRLPFQGNNTLSMLRSLALDDPPPASSLNPDVPAELSDLIAELLQKDCERRPASAEVVRARLAAIESAWGRRPAGQEISADPTIQFPITIAGSKLAAGARRGSARGATAGLPSSASARRRWINALLAAALIASLALAAIFLRVETPAGTIVLEVDQPELAGAVVSVDDQQKITIQTKGSQEPIEVTADANQHTLRVIKGGFETFTKEFTVKSGQAQPIRVHLEPRRAVSSAKKPPSTTTVVGSGATAGLPSSARSDGFALEFNGKDSYVTLPTLRYDGSHPVTLEATIVPYGNQSRGDVIGDRGTISLGFPAGGSSDSKRAHGHFRVTLRDGEQRGVWGNEPVQLHKRLCIGAVLTDSVIRIFVDGKLQESKELNAPFQVNNRAFIFASAQSGPTFLHSFLGLIDEVRISKVARYTGDYSPVARFEPDADTLALYHFDEGQGDILTDSSGNNHHGKIVNAKWVPGIAGGPPAATPQSAAPPLAIAPFDADQAKAHQEAWANHLGVPVEQTNSIGIKLRLIPPGEFKMGSTDEQVEAALRLAEEIKAVPIAKDRIQRAERPQHRVVITKPFLLGTTEVTIAQFREFVVAANYVTDTERLGGGHAGRRDLAGRDIYDPQRTWQLPGFDVTDESPVAQITWNDAVAYCDWLSQQEQTTYRLPTEAEWEYACRAGTTAHYSFGDDVNLLAQYAWYDGNSSSGPHPVGTKLPNAFGLFDMHGNLWEWCADYFETRWYEKFSPIDPNGPSSGTSRVLRGGNFTPSASQCRSAYRADNPPSGRFNSVGFRVVRELTVPLGNPKSEIANPKSTTAGYALEFNGKDSYVDLPTLRYDGSHPITLEATIVPFQNGSRGHVIGDINSRNVNGEERVGGVSLRFPHGYGADAARGVFEEHHSGGAFTNDTLVPNKRIHVAGVMGDGSLRLYVDGKLQATRKVTTSYQPSPDSFSIGARMKGMERGSYFSGVIDEVRVSRVARYSTDFTPPERFEPDQDTLALYHFDEGSGIELKDSSGNNHHCKIVNAKWVNGIAGGPPSSTATHTSLDFSARAPSGGTARVELPEWLPNGPLTIEMYTTPRVVPPPNRFRRFFVQGGGGELAQFGDAWTWQISRPKEDRLDRVFEPKSVIAGKRVHVAAISTGKELRLFLDGRPMGSTPITIALGTEPRGMLIGGNAPGSGADPTEATIDELRISKIARYDAPFTPPPAPLASDANTIGLYHFDEGQGDVLTDSSGNARHGTIVGAQWIAAPAAGVPLQSQANPKSKIENPKSESPGGFALEFNGKDSYVDLPTLHYDGSHPTTIEATVKAYSSDFGVVIGDVEMVPESKGVARAGSAIYFPSGAPKSRGAKGAYNITGTVAGINLFTLEAAAPDRITHLAAIIDNSTARLFVNGKLQGTVALRGKYNPSPQSFLLGVRSFADRTSLEAHYRGIIDEVRISKVARYTTDYVPQLRLESDEHTLALYHFDEGAGDELKDSSGNNHHGKIVNAKWVPGLAAGPR
jgi:formylglycine-generating enzyme required for sulfatase activity/serine/threonine protein kinase